MDPQGGWKWSLKALGSTKETIWDSSLWHSLRQALFLFIGSFLHRAKVRGWGTTLKIDDSSYTHTSLLTLWRKTQGPAGGPLLITVVAHSLGQHFLPIKPIESCAQNTQASVWDTISLILQAPGKNQAWGLGFFSFPDLSFLIFSQVFIIKHWWLLKNHEFMVSALLQPTLCELGA